MNAHRRLPHQLGVAELSAAFAHGELTARQATEAYLARIDSQDAKVNSYLHVTAHAALDAATASDARRAAGKALGPLDGIPIALKDNIDVAGVPTTAGIAVRRGRLAHSDAFVVQRLKRAGVVILGKLNMHEAALGATNANEAYGVCHNPHRHGFTPGGSSGGSGAAVAAGLCAAALGTDTLGSVRIPAAYCGVAGFKPTYGLVSTRGTVPLSWTLDHVGPLARKVEDLGLLLDAMAGFDSECAESRARTTGDTRYAGPYSQRLDGLVIGRVVGLEAVPLQPGVIAAFDRAIDTLRSLGATIIDVRFDGYDFTPLRLQALLTIEAEAAVVHADDLAADPDGFSETFRTFVGWGARQPAHKLAAAYRAVADVQLIARRALAQAPVLALPTAPHEAFAFADPVPHVQADLTSLANMARIPSATVPMGRGDTGLPVGLQLLAGEFQDALVMRVAAAYEAASASYVAPD
ncbi:amidase [Roseiterribacter gracilis]|uniref:Amidase n=1 Tax=Roseiterribacter gracilis TaxID=2812848 RepID=A0A8S8XAL2_9PROT|nr:amidase [Rhodospirillales bacterium TMPK1]